MVPPSSLPAWRWALAAALVLALFWRAGALPLRGEEPRRAVVALEMWSSGDPLVPRIHEEAYHNKPPAFNVLLAGVFALTGRTDEAAVRWPGLLCFLATAWAVGRFARSAWGHEAGWLTGLAFATSADLLFFGTLYAGEIDLFFALMVTLQALAIYRFERAGRPWALFLASYALMALGVLTKGPPSILFQGLTLLAWLGWTRRWRWLVHPAHAAGLALAAAAVGGYFAAYAAQGEDAWGFAAQLFSEASQRTGFESRPLDTLRDSLAFPLRLGQLLLPWSLFALLPLGGALRRKAGDPALAFAALFVLANVGPYWFTGELRNRYVYMFLPFLAAVCVRWWTLRRPEHGLVRGLETLLGAALVLAALAAPFAPLLPPVDTLRGAWPLALATAAGFGLLAGAWWRGPRARRAWVLAAALVFGRFVLDASYVPLAAADETLMPYRPHAAALAGRTRGQALVWSGPPWVRHPSLGIGPWSQGTYRIEAPPPLDYALLYYLMRARGTTLPYDPRPAPGTWALAPVSALPSGADPVYRLYDDWQRRDLVLYRQP
jgi:4-amino-4-deoxy-L-arabinose transferase-like glycosyltransferase